MSFENIWEKDGVYRKYANSVDGDEVTKAMEEVHANVLFDSISYVINDYLDVSDYDITTTDVITLAALDRAAALSNPNIKIAFVLTESAALVLAKLYGDLINKSPYISETFTSVEEARAWAI